MHYFFKNHCKKTRNNKGLKTSIRLFAMLVISFLTLTNTAHAQTLSGTALLNDIRSGNITIAEGANQITELTNLTNSSATDFLTSLADANGVNLNIGGDLVDNFLEGTFGQENVETITNIIENVENIVNDPSAGLDLLETLAEGEIDPAIAEALSTISNIGDLLTAETIADVFANPLVSDALENFTIGDATAQELIDQIEQISGEILDAIQDAAPELYDALVEIFNGEQGLQDALTTALGGTPTGTSGSGGSTSDPREDNEEICGVDCKASCGNCAIHIHNNHVAIRGHTTAEFINHQNWMFRTFFIENIADALMKMTNQLVTGGMQQMQIIGSFFDAKEQLETQRDQQILKAQAHKDYHPSEALCVVGTNTRSFAESKRKSEFASHTLSERMMRRQLNEKRGISEEGEFTDVVSRIDMFVEKFCDKTQGGMDASGSYGFGLLCKNSNPEPEQINADINYTHTIENKLTLDTDFSGDPKATSSDEENIFALSANLFAHETFPVMDEEAIAQRNGNPKKLINLYLDLRSMAAKRSVAQNSFAAITGMRAEGDQKSGPFLKALLQESGVREEEIEGLVGENPSYFAQEEVMMKTMLQNPAFYTNLYDKPANIDRMGTALLALEIIQDRNIYESLLRSEAVLATLIETLLLKEQRRVSADIQSIDESSRTRKRNTGAAE